MVRTAAGENVYARLREAQARDGYVTEAAVREIARDLSLPLYHVQGLVSFYPAFRAVPGKQIRAQVCRDLSCYLAGAATLHETWKSALAVRGDVAVETVSCLGRCEQAPAAAVNDRVHGAAGDALLRDLLAGDPPTPREPDAFPQGAAQADPYPTPADHYGAFRECLTGGRTPEQTIAALKESGLCGMGGAGFPTGVKWEIVRGAAGAPKYVVCNADESEPGTFKDRVILDRWPHLVVEGVLLCQWVVGAEEAWVYVRHEYGEQARRVDAAIEEARRVGLIGANVLGTGRRFEVRTFESPGGYICGEETALLEAMEGKRAEPRNKPPFPGTHGLWGKPTVINNVETFAFVPLILRRGGAWFASQGQNGGLGLKFLALSGHVNRPGVYEAPMGISARRLIDEFGVGVRGRAVKAYAPGGASSGFLPASELDAPLEFKAMADRGSMLGSGAVVVVAEGTDMVDLALNAVRFFKHESCGKCVPCREGTAKTVAMLESALGGRAAGPLDAVIAELSQAMALTSICGLGQAALNPILSVIKHWPEEWASLLRRGA